MKRWQVLAVLALFIAVNVGGFAVNKAGNSIESIGTYGSGAEAGSEGKDMLYFPLSSSKGAYYKMEISSLDGHRFNVLFTNESVMMAARDSSAPIEYIADRSALNVTSVTLEGRLPDSTDVYMLLILSAEPGVKVTMETSGDQGAFPPGLRPVLQAAYFTCWISSIALLFLMVYAYDRYRNKRGPRR